MKDSQKATIIVEDAAGNTSKPLEIKSGYDTLAPDKPTAQVNAEGTSVTGTAEPNAKLRSKIQLIRLSVLVLQTRMVNLQLRFLLL